MRFQALAAPGEAAPPGIVEGVQRAIDEFSDLNGWPGLQQELFKRRRRDGEYFLRHFANEETGGYRMCLLRDKIVAGLGPLMDEGQPPSWTTYVSVDDADKTAARVTEAGGQVLVEPMDVMAAGRMAVFMDPTSAATRPLAVYSAATT